MSLDEKKTDDVVHQEQVGADGLPHMSAIEAARLEGKRMEVRNVSSTNRINFGRNMVDHVAYPA